MATVKVEPRAGAVWRPAGAQGGGAALAGALHTAAQTAINAATAARFDQQRTLVPRNSNRMSLLLVCRAGFSPCPRIT